MRGHTDRIESVAISPDGRTALSGSWDNGVAISPDGRTALSASYDGTLKQWDLVSGKELLLGENSGLTSVAFSPDSRTALSGSSYL